MSKIKISFRSVLTFITIILVGFVVWENLDSVEEAIKNIGNTNIFILILLIPEQLFMYYCCGQIFFSFINAKKNTKKASPFDLMRISLELNFVNHAIPAGGFGGLAYTTWRFKKFGVTPGQSSFMYALRYAITVCANQAQTLLAIAILMIFGRDSIPDGSLWVVWLTITISLAILLGIFIIIAIASNAKRVHHFSKIISSVCNFLVRFFTFGHKRNKLTYEKIDAYLMDIHSDLTIARHNKKVLIKPIIWGIIYSFFEVGTYWVVAISRGNPWVMPQIMIGEAIGSVFGTLFPIGPYEAGMAGVMAILGVSDAIATVCITRVIVLGMTILSGYGFYQNAISKIGRKDKEHERAA